MQKQLIHVEKGSALTRIVAVLSALAKDHDLLVTVERAKRKRSNEQNAYLWAGVYPTILKHLPSEWTADDLHEYFLGEHFGWETLTGLTKKRMKPKKRSSKLSILEFMDYIGFVQRQASEMGIYIEDPK